MWLILFIMVFQDVQQAGSIPINALVYLPGGEKVELVDVTIKGPEPYSFEFKSEGQTSFINLYRVVRISRADGNGIYEVLFDTGERETGRISSLAFEVAGVVGNKSVQTFYLQHIDRIQFLSGEILRSCRNDHYEAYTAFPFCPVCGEELELGPFHDLDEEDEKAPNRSHQLRLDPRDPAPLNGRRGG